MVITLDAASSKLSSQNQITIPGNVRNTLGLKPGDRVVFIEEGGKVTIRNLKDLINEVADTFKDIGQTENESRAGFRFAED